MIKLSPARALWVITALWCLVLSGMWIQHDYEVTHGTEIRLRVLPVDPRDIFRGDYVVLAYEIGSITLPQGEAALWLKNETAYVGLAEKEGYHIAHVVQREPPAGGPSPAARGYSLFGGQTAARSGGLFIRGEISYAAGNEIRIRYGIENYFVPEGEGRKLEEARNRKKLDARVMVSPYGAARLKKLEIKY